MPIFEPIVQNITPNPPVPDYSKPGWPFPTTTEDWETDTRLRRLGTDVAELQQDLNEIYQPYSLYQQTNGPLNDVDGTAIMSTNGTYNFWQGSGAPGNNYGSPSFVISTPSIIQADFEWMIQWNSIPAAGQRMLTWTPAYRNLTTSTTATLYDRIYRTFNNPTTAAATVRDTCIASLTRYTLFQPGTYTFGLQGTPNYHPTTDTIQALIIYTWLMVIPIPSIT